MDQVTLLSEHKSRRATLCSIKPLCIRVQVPRVQGLGAVNLNDYNEGVYAQYSRATELLHIHQFPSLNHGTEMKQWDHKSPAPAVVGLAIDSALDLLVWLEARHQNPFHIRTNTSHDYQYTIHLHSMATNIEHPEASAGSITHSFRVARTIAAHTVHILGNLLAILFISMRERHACHIVIWDWTTGVELAVS
jgi:hypothetical protein